MAERTAGESLVSSFKEVFVSLGDNLSAHVKARLLKHLNAVPHLIVHDVGEDVDDVQAVLKDALTLNGEGALLLSLGNTSFTRQEIPTDKLATLPAESFWLRSGKLDNRGGGHAAFLCSDGRPLDENLHQNISFSKQRVHYGAVVGAYAALEALGFGFLHPTVPFVPPRISFPPEAQLAALNVTESPYWPERGFHIHTQHPLEVTEVLQGHDIPIFGPHGPECDGRPTPRDLDFCERWEHMVKDVDTMFEWSVANRLNKVEWLLLGSYKWGDLDTSDYRQKRLRLLTSLGHEYSLMIGADIPIGNIQQHAWHMVNTRLPFTSQQQQIHDRVDWVFGAHFDFLTTESGLSEFTHPECSLMLDLLNAFAGYVNGTWGREACIKVHISTGQTCDQFPDPRTGEPLNFNFLPALATPELGVFPHTVQVYGLQDPSGGTYGNKNFGALEDYMFYEAKKGNRSVQFYGETAYWVNVDVDVPLFIPLYGERRLADMRYIAQKERELELRVDGQMNFDSGWEWGYWLSDVITARASWNPMMETRSGWSAFHHALAPLRNVFRESAATRTLGEDLSHLVVRITREQERLLVFGQVADTGEIKHPDSRNPEPYNFSRPEPAQNLSMLSGIAYLSGDDTWVDIPRLFGIPMTQPDKVHFTEADSVLWPRVLVLLRELERVFDALAKEARELRDRGIRLAVGGGACQTDGDTADASPMMCEVSDNADTTDDDADGDAGVALSQGLLAILNEVADCTDMLALRAGFVRRLYESRDPVRPLGEKRQLQRQTRGIISTAAATVKRREAAYRVPVQRVAAWRENPTVYRYGYLWAVHSLFYWWRDQGKAEAALDLEETTLRVEGVTGVTGRQSKKWLERISFSFRSELSPCYLNRMDVSEVSVGIGRYALQLLRYLVTWLVPFSSNGYPFEMVKCLAPPTEEYEFPKDLPG